MTQKNTHQDQNLVTKFKDLTNNFEDELSELILPARHLSVADQNKIVRELRATVQNINFMITSLPSVGEE
jgi:hypothetical protein